MSQRTYLIRSCLGLLALCCLASPAPGGQILSDNFNGTGDVPKNWQQILGASGDIKEKPQDLAITDSTGGSAGIVSSLSTSVFNPQSVVTTSQVQINSVNPDGNAIFGLIGLSKSGSLTGSLAAGIDAKGNVFIVEQDSQIPQTIVPVDMIKSYTGGSILMSFTINSKGVEVTAPGLTPRELLFKDDLNNFSLADAFGNGAIPALVGASQPKTTGGSAHFGSILVTTGLSAAVPEPASLQTLAIGLAGLGVVEFLRRWMCIKGRNHQRSHSDE
jgi:hypothetical protein